MIQEMKKFFAIAAMLVATLSASAQNDDLKNEVGLYYGLGSATNIVSAIGTAFNLDNKDKKGFWGPIGVDYFYHTSPVVAVGGMVSLYLQCEQRHQVYLYHCDARSEVQLAA